jgi:pimeloyl-ACP methyl ester carboxylesterase
MPVLAIGGGSVYGDAVVNTVREVADDVTGVTIPNCGHYVPEEAPERMLDALEAFLV